MGRLLFAKVTNECKLNCSFCYNHQEKGTIDLDFLSHVVQKYDVDEIALHGGEPFLYPEVCLDILDRFQNVSISATSSLVWKWTKEREAVLKRICGLATSYSVDRFEGKSKAYALFLENMEKAHKFQHRITLLLNLSEKQLQQPPEELAEEILSFPVDKISIERVFIPSYPDPESFYAKTDEYLSKLFQLIPRKMNVLMHWMQDAAKYDTTVFPYNCSCITADSHNRVWGCPQMEFAEKIKKKRMCLDCKYYPWCKGDCPGFPEVCAFPKNTFSKIYHDVIGVTL